MKTESVVAEVSGERLIIRVKQLRGDRTLSDIAQQIGMRQDDLGRIERGETKSMQYETLLKLCTVFDVTPSQLFAVESAIPQKTNPLERVLAGIEEGAIHTHRVGQGNRKLRPTEPKLDLEAAADFPDFEMPTTSRRRKRMPTSTSK